MSPELIEENDFLSQVACWKQLCRKTYSAEVAVHNSASLGNRSILKRITRKVFGQASLDSDGPYWGARKLEPMTGFEPVTCCLRIRF
ncbi:MAG TPA: hypothetical protein VJ835_06955 [Fimbriimonadaceae bacterium]|nr:hypothetical protein [Fimbriimonadaceae bacterium]